MTIAGDGVGAACRNEALNMIRMQELLDQSEFCSSDVVIPVAYMGLTTRWAWMKPWGCAPTWPEQSVRRLMAMGLGPNMA